MGGPVANHGLRARLLFHTGLKGFDGVVDLEAACRRVAYRRDQFANQEPTNPTRKSSSSPRRP